MEKRPNILFWYFNEGVHDLLEIWKNFLFFVLEYFSVFELIKTLFSPWHRDVSQAGWRGIHPILMVKLFVANAISRFLGAIVRTVVIAIGLAAFLLVLVCGLVANILWISAPFAMVAIFVFAPRFGFDLVYVLALLIFWILAIIVLYINGTVQPMIQIDLQSLLKSPVFERICGRQGIARKRFADEILENDQAFDEFLKARNLTRKDFSQIAAWELGRHQKKVDARKFWRRENLSKIVPIGANWRYGYTVNLDRYSTDLSQHDYSEYAKTDLVGRSEEYEILKLLLERPDQNCALIVGNSGVGKKTLIHELARNIRMRKEGRAFCQMRMLKLDLGRVISDAVSKGQDTENFLRLLFFEAANAGNVILIIEHFEHFLADSGSSTHFDISAVLNEFLNVPTFQVIASSSIKEYHQLIEKHDSLVKYFEIIEMREPSEEQTITILLDQLEKYEQKRVLFTAKALQSIVRDSGRHNWEFPLPERAIDLAMGVLMFWEKKSDEQFITEKTVNDYLSLKTGVAQGEIEGIERKKLMNLEAMLHRQVIGQDEAIKQVASALKRARSGIANSKKPIGSFLFLGPTGVGKTETAKALAKTYFGDEEKMIRLDMSEFQSPNSIDRLLGSSELNQQGRLVTKIKDNPYCLLLLDEIEKAYPEILDIFLQILDEGFVSDAFGEKINFRNTMIIATSNVGAALIKKMIEQNESAEKIQQAVIDNAIDSGVFRTEFLNRFESVIFFRPLNENELTSVVRLQLQKLARRLDKEKNIKVSFDGSIIEKIIKKGYNPIFGARSLNRYIEDEVENLIANKIISGEVANGQQMEIIL